MRFIMSSCSCRFVTAVVLVVLLACVSPLHAQRRDFDPPLWAKLSVFRYADDAPLYQVVKDVPEFVTTTEVTQTFIEELENRILDRLKNPREMDDDDLLEPCNYRRAQGRRSLETYFGLRGWDEPDLACITDFHGTRFRKNEKPLLSLENIYKAVRERALALREVADQVAESTVGNWTNSTWRVDTEFSRLSQTCLLTGQGGVRVDGKWYSISGITNQDQRQNLPRFGRQFLMEHLRTEDGKLQFPLLMRLSERPKGDMARVPIDNTTTTIASFRGVANPSSFYSVFPEDNLAIQDSLDDSDLFIQQADDATTPSNIAILALPLALNLVPIALVADVSTVTTLAYALMSDILTVIPLGIKGIELIFIGNQRVRSSVVRITSSINGSISNTAAYELWTSECFASGDIRPTGIIFLVLSLLFMVGGVVAEFVAKSFATRRRVLHKQALANQKLVIPGADNALLRSQSLASAVVDGSRTQFSEPPTLTSEELEIAQKTL